MTYHTQVIHNTTLIKKKEPRWRPSFASVIYIAQFNQIDLQEQRVKLL
jgi:hypothetical protein